MLASTYFGDRYSPAVVKTWSLANHPLNLQSKILMLSVKEEPEEALIPSVQLEHIEPVRQGLLTQPLAVKLEFGVSRRLAIDYIEVPTFALLKRTERKRKKEEVEQEVKRLADVSHYLSILFLQYLRFTHNCIYSLKRSNSKNPPVQPLTSLRLIAA